ncbi:hypothetical protein ACWC4A_47835 [Streptomyces mirabilis]
MEVWQACLWGLVGVALIEAYGLWSATHTPKKPQWPWTDDDGKPVYCGYVVSVVCRCAMGVLLNAAYAASQQITGPLAAVTIGIAAPLFIAQMAVRGEAPSPAGPTAPQMGVEAASAQTAGGTAQVPPRRAPGKSSAEAVQEGTLDGH